MCRFPHLGGTANLLVSTLLTIVLQNQIQPVDCLPLQPQEVWAHDGNESLLYKVHLDDRLPLNVVVETSSSGDVFYGYNESKSQRSHAIFGLGLFRFSFSFVFLCVCLALLLLMCGCRQSSTLLFRAPSLAVCLDLV